jgi:hypothetical protein
MADIPRPTLIGLTRRSAEGQRGYLDGLRSARGLVAASSDTTDALARLDLVIEAMAEKEAAEGERDE